MKTRKFLWAVLPMMAAALAMTACGGDDDTDTKPVPVSPTDNTDKTEKSIPYTVTVKGDPETTRATVSGMTMNFADDDELYISDGANIHGVLTLQSGAKSDEATFSGTLYYEASTPPNSSTSLTATLVSSDNKAAVITDGRVTSFSYCTDTKENVCSTLSEAVSKYSQLTGEGNYGSGEIVLSQSTAFLKFKVNLEDGTSSGNSVFVVVNDGSNEIGKGYVNASGTNQFIDIYAEFYVPVQGGTTISTNAKMWVGSVGTPSDESIAYGNTADRTLTGGTVYNVVEKTKDFVRLWANGPVWATKNLKASGVLARGKYYAWGETTGCFKETTYAFTWANYNLGDETSLTKYNATDKKTTLESADDAANADATPKGIWRMPTGTEFSNLVTKTTYAWTKVSSFQGGKFTGNTTGYENKAIFLPAAGYWVSNEIKNYNVDGRYWSSSIGSENNSVKYSYGRFLVFDETNGARTNSHDRCTGRPIRPVKN